MMFRVPVVVWMTTLSAVCLLKPATGFSVGSKQLIYQGAVKKISLSKPCRHYHAPRTRSITCIHSATTELVGEDRSARQKSTIFNDVVLVAAHAVACFMAAALFCVYEDYDCSHLKPESSTLRPQAIRGMGQGRQERLEDWKGGDVLVQSSDISLKQIPSYNEVMERHRLSRVPFWKQSASNANVKHAVQALYNALDATESLKFMANDYQWTDMQQLIRQPVLSTDLEQACSVLRSAVGTISPEGRAEIGFDWGSCAMRHCGAAADAQEALAELYNLIGVLEPFECNFCLDIVERSLRDMLAVIPSELHQHRKIGPYRPYKVYEPMSETMISGIQEESSPSLDMDYVNALAELRNEL